MKRITKLAFGGLATIVSFLTITNGVEYYKVKEMLDNGVPREAVVDGAIYYKNISNYPRDELTSPNIRLPKMIKSGFDKTNQQWDIYDTGTLGNMPFGYFGKELALMIN